MHFQLCSYIRSATFWFVELLWHLSCSLHYCFTSYTVHGMRTDDSCLPLLVKVSRASSNKLWKKFRIFESKKTLGSGFASWVLVKMRRTSARIHGRKKTLEPFSLCHFQHITLCSRVLEGQAVEQHAESSTEHVLASRTGRWKLSMNLGIENESRIPR